jgi:glycosyltransferase involved in cell wall biosynthesis
MSKKLVFLIEPFYTGSHRQWVTNLVKYAISDIQIFILKGRHWKWRMAAGAIQLAEEVNDSPLKPSYFFVSDMLDVGLFKSLLRPDFQDIPIYVYFHENQLTYPWNEVNHQNRDRQFAWRNFTSILVAEKVVFNSEFHKTEVLKAIPEFLSAFPDKLNTRRIKGLEKKFVAIAPGIDLDELEVETLETRKSNRILWNHRWEQDKNPELFFKTLFLMKSQNIDFELVVCGEQFGKVPDIFEEAQDRLKHQIVHWGYFKNRNEYLQWMKTCSILPVTSNQEFFGLSVMEAAFCGVQPLLPRRLSYPSLYAGLDVFYETDNDLASQLKLRLREKKEFKLPLEFERYAWSNLIEEYEELWSGS